MKLRKLVASSLVVLFSGLSFAHAATVHLTDGRSIEADSVGRDGDTVILDVSGIEIRLASSDVAAIDMATKTSATTSEQTAQAPAEQATTTASSAAQQSMAIPAGTQLMVRMNDSINTRANSTGQRFTGVLEANLMAGDLVIAERGTTVYGRITELTKAGRMAGSASMSIELTELLIDNQMVAIVTETLSAQGNNTAKSSAGRTARSAAIGGLIDGSSGAKTGAKVGLGASLLTQGNDIELPKGTLVDFTLRAPLNS
ncbi:hypothetical protein [Neiella marina]|nr:hypothetical protein [Neiella marina]